MDVFLDSLECVGTYISQTDVLDQCRVEFALCDDFLEKSPDDVVQIGIFETAFLAFCERSSDSEGDDNIVRVLLCAVANMSRQYIIFERAGSELAYMAETPVLEVERCEKTEASLWVAILSLVWIMIFFLSRKRSSKGRKQCNQ